LAKLSSGGDSSSRLDLLGALRLAECAIEVFKLPTFVLPFVGVELGCGMEDVAAACKIW